MALGDWWSAVLLGLSQAPAPRGLLGLDALHGSDMPHLSLRDAPVGREDNPWRAHQAARQRIQAVHDAELDRVGLALVLAPTTVPRRRGMGDGRKLGHSCRIVALERHEDLWRRQRYRLLGGTIVVGWLPWWRFNLAPKSAERHLAPRQHVVERHGRRWGAGRRRS